MTLNRATLKQTAIETALSELVAARSGKRVRLALQLDRVGAILIDQHGRPRLPKVKAWIDRRVASIRKDHPWIVVHAPVDVVRGDRGEALIVSQELSRSGSPRIVLELACIFRDAGYGVTVVTPTDGPMRRELLAERVRVVIDSTTTYRGEGPATLLRAVDFVFCNTVVTRRAVRALRSTVPVFWYIHEVGLVNQWLDEDASFGADFAIPHAVWVGSELAAAPIRPFRPDVRVVPYGVAPIDTGGATARDDGIVRIAVFASLERRKGQDLAAAAVRSLSPSDRDRVRLTLFGRTLDAAFAASLVTSKDDPLVSLGGELETADYRAALAATDIVLMPSREDTLPLVSIDALGARRILACTTTTGTAAYLTDGVDGFVAEPTAASIASMLVRALEMRSTWDAIAERGAALHAAAFSKEAFSNLVLDSVRQAIHAEAGR